jgi:hypothetical protein
MKQKDRGLGAYYVSNVEKGKKVQVEKKISSYSLVEAVDRILDKSIVIDAWVRATLLGIEILAVEARMVRASIETFLKYDKAIDLTSIIIKV